MPTQTLFGPGEMLITGGTFTQINHPQPETGFTTLSQKISHGALYDSAERYGAGRCHPGTREEIISMILEWVNNPHPESQVLWLWGPAGAGKSSILQTVSEILCQSHRPRYGGSFFFAKGVPGRGDGRNLFSTLAYQLGCNVSGMRGAVNAAMVFDPLLPSKNLTTQFHSLIVDPLLHLPSVSDHTPTIIIDGLDECQGSDDQRAILTLIIKSLTSPRRVPLRFIIGSRPEHAIRDEFDRPALAALTERIELGHSRKTSEDIRKYLQDGFKEIYERNRDIMEDLETPWPTLDRVNMFVRNASGQFVYASTVLRFIGSYSDYSDPQKQLEIISKPGASRAEAFSPLDQLYIAILSNYPRRKELMLVLGGLLVKASLSTIVHCLDISPSELRMVLRAISSLLKYPRSRVNIDNKELEAAFGPVDQNPIAFAHLSFRDFLQDKLRSAEFWVETKEVYSKLHHKLMDTFVAQLNTHEPRPVITRTVIPIAYDEFWGGYSYIVIPKSTSPSIVIKRLFDLRDALKAFLLVLDDTPLSRLKDVLQTIHVVYKYLTSLKEFLTIDATFTGEDHKELVSLTRKVIDSCFQRTISVERFIQTRNAPIFILGGSGSITLETLVGCLDIPEVEVVDFLKDNKHLLECDIELVYYRDQKLDVLTRDYSCRQLLINFLMSEQRSGALHRSLRESAIKTWRELVVRLVKDPDNPLTDDHHSFILEFLTKSTLIRLQKKTDLGFMLPLFTELCDLDWRTLNVVDRDGGDSIFLTAFNILRFLHQTLCNPKTAPLTTFRATITTAMEKMYEALIIRPTSTPYFSEAPLFSFSDDIVGIPPYNINPADNEHEQVYEGVLADSETLDSLKEMLQHSAEGTKYKLSIDRAAICTSILEFLLRVWVTRFFQDSECDIGRIIGLSSRFLFVHAGPSEKIRLALLTLRDLDSKRRLKPNLPISIVDSAQELVLRHRTAMDPENKLQAWLDELRGRCAVRKEKYPDSDDPSDVESLDDDDSDLTDMNHDDDHGYDLDEEQEEPATLEQGADDLDSIYAWGD